MINIIFAEDDPAMRIILRKVLTSISDVKILGEAANGRELLEMVRLHEPDVVLLDIDMPELNGMEAAREIFDSNPKIFLIFATGYDDYTHDAFEIYAFDYILKPFKLDRIRKTIERIKALKQQIDESKIVATQPKENSKNVKLMIQSNGVSSLLKIEDIIFITRIEQKSIIHTVHGSISNYESLKNLEDKLSMEKNFFRCHKGFIVNADMVLELIPWGNKTYSVKLANTKERALMTIDKVKEFKDMYCL